MSTYFVKVRFERERIVKVEAINEQVALDAACNRMENDLLNWPADWSDFEKDIVDVKYTDDDSIIAMVNGRGEFSYYEYAADDPGRRG